MNIDFNEEVLSGFNSLLGKVKAFKKMSPNIEGLDFTLSFYVVTMNKHGVGFVTIGTRENPEGISVTDSKYVVFLKEDYSVYNIMRTEDVKSVIKANYIDLKRGLDEDYEKMGVYLEDEMVSPTSS